MRSRIVIALGIVAMATIVACSLNPQPLPPGANSADGNDAGVGDASSDTPTVPFGDAGAGADGGGDAAASDGGFVGEGGSDGGSDAAIDGADGGDGALDATGE